MAAFSTSSLLLFPTKILVSSVLLIKLLLSLDTYVSVITLAEFFFLTVTSRYYSPEKPVIQEKNYLILKPKDKTLAITYTVGRG